MEIKKYFLITQSDWKTLENGAIRDRKVNTMPQLPVKETAKKYNVQYPSDQSRAKSRPGSKTIQDFINHAKKVVGKEKILPANLKRAMLLSDIFTEKRHQLKFHKALKRVNRELMDKENDRFSIELENYQLEQFSKKQEEHSHKVALGKRLKNEILESSLKKRREKIEQVNQEREEISKINNEVENEEKEMKIQVIEAKQTIDKMHQEDLQTKFKEVDTSNMIEKEELKAFDTQSEFIYKTGGIRRDIDKLVNVRKPPKVETFESVTKEVIQRYYDLPVVKKSKLEEKRDLYAKILTQQRVQTHKLEAEELLKRKDLENQGKEIEYQLRCDNIKVTKLFEQSNRRRLLGRIKENRKIWNNQCEEKRVTGEKCKQEDINRRELLSQKLRHEDDEYFTTVKTILNEYQKQNKITIPIIKCLKEGHP